VREKILLIDNLIKKKIRGGRNFLDGRNSLGKEINLTQKRGKKMIYKFNISIFKRMMIFIGKK